MDRFFVERFEHTPGARLALPDEEAHHLRVKRLRPGDRVRIFDGRGGEVLAEVLDLGRREVVLAVLPERVCGAAPAVPVTVGVALPEGKRTQLLLEKATELLASSIFPLVTSRTPSSRGETFEARLDRWRRATIEAAKQCGAARLPELGRPRGLEDALAEGCAEPGALRLILDPSPGASPIRDALARPRPERAIVLVGPEGGFEDGEVVAAAELGWKPVRLGPSILRVETAAIAALAAIQVAYG